MATGRKMPMEDRSVSAGTRATGSREFHFERKHFDFIAGLIKKRAGIVLRPSKFDMVYGRLSRRLRALDMTSFDQYCDFIASLEGTDELDSFRNALTTNLTKFFRESHHFDHLASIVLAAKISEMQAGGSRRIRIWSAASSSGEEAYSAAMVLLDTVGDIGCWDARILATDIDTNMVNQCREGIYEADKIESIPRHLRKRSAIPVPGSDNTMRMADSLRSLIVFKPLNLLGHWPIKGPFDVIFCRNVAIYFDKPTQKTMFDRFADLLADDGYLYIGHAESLFNVTNRFQLIGKTIYEKA